VIQILRICVGRWKLCLQSWSHDRLQKLPNGLVAFHGTDHRRIFFVIEFILTVVRIDNNIMEHLNCLFRII
jgi:hypothetical protein